MSEESLTISPSAPSTEPGAAEPKRGFLLPGLIAGVVVASCLAITFFVLWLLAADRSVGERRAEVTTFTEDQRAEVEAITEDVVETLTTYDSTNADQLRGRLAEVATGSFLDKAEEFIQHGLVEALKGASVSSRGRIIYGPDIAFISGSRAMAVLGVEQVYQNRDNPTGDTIEYSLQIDFTDVEDAGWRADDVTLLSAQSE